MEHSILGWLLIGLGIGLVAGLLARSLMPHRDPGGVIVSMLIGICGALLGGFVANGLGGGAVSEWRDHAFAAIGAVVLIAAYRVMIVRRIG